MVNSFVGALALASIPSALAFRNSSPYFLFSTAEYVPRQLQGALGFRIHLAARLTTATDYSFQARIQRSHRLSMSRTG